MATGQVIATVAGSERLAASELCAGCDGVLRGLIRSGARVAAGVKVGDIDPRAERAYCFTISDKALAVGGGVLEAILAS